MGLGSLLVVGVVLALERSMLPPTPFYGSGNLAMHTERLERLDAREGVEILALGDSYVAAGVDAGRLSEVLGETVYAFGLISSDLHAQSLILERVILPDVRPGVILWCVGSEARRASTINHVYLASPALRGADDGLGRLRRRIERWSPLWQRRRPLDWLGAFEQPLDTLYDEHGFRSSSRSLTRERNGERQLPPPRGKRAVPWVVDAGRRHSMRPTVLPDAVLDHFAASEAEARAAFERVLAHVQELGIEVLAWTPPWWQGKFDPDDSHARALAAGDHDAHQAWLLGVLAERGIPYLNLRYFEPVSTNSDDFGDETHLSPRGAEHLVPVLADYLRDRRVPPDFRGLPSAAERRALAERR